ncbi:MAG: hypothetical protein FWF36_00285 [Propionibacteriaceae bacterium]|nr:hypothetical protein [Propionibacteriaceae bacterium]
MSQDTRDVRQRVTTELHKPETTAQEASMLERLSDPALQKQTTTQPQSTSASGKTGLQWVRASDLLNSHGTRLPDCTLRGRRTWSSGCGMACRRSPPPGEAPPARL